MGLTIGYKLFTPRRIRYDWEIAAFGGLLKDAAESAGERVHGPIFDDPRFERLEAGGRAELDSKTIEALYHLPLP